MELSADLWANALETSPLPTAFVDRELRYRFVNRAYESWFGWKRADVVGRTMQEVVGKRALDAVHAHTQTALAGGAINFTATIPYQLRGVRRMNVSYVAARDGTGEVVGFFAYIEDITERHDAEGAVAAALDGMADGYMALSAQLRFTYVNSGAARFYGLQREEILGRDLEAVFPGSLNSPTGHMLREVLRTRHPLRRELPSAGRPGKVCLIDMVPLTQGGVGVVIQDTTAQGVAAPVTLTAPAGADGSAGLDQ